MWRIEEKIHFDGISVFRRCHVRRTESRTTVSSETKDSDAIRNMAAEQRRQMEHMGLPHTGDRELNEKVEYQYESGVVLNELLAPLVVPNRNVPKSIGTWAGMTFQMIGL